jgi:hypothetical protein
MKPRQQIKCASPPTGIVRPLDPSDPKNLNHPCHDQQWLELARAIGRSLARKQYEEDHLKDRTDETNS